MEACTQMVVPRNVIFENTYTAIASELDQQELICLSLSLGHFLVTETEIATKGRRSQSHAFKTLQTI